MVNTEHTLNDKKKKKKKESQWLHIHSARNNGKN